MKALGIVALVIGGILAAAGGPILWAVLVMVGVPVVALLLAGAAGHEGEHPHFAPPHPPR